MGIRRKLTGMAVVIGTMGGLVACNGAAVLNSITPSSAYNKTADLSYGPLPRHTLDVYRADRPVPGAPTVVFVHGGSWSEGRKDIYKFVGDAFASQGFDVVIPNYRLFPEARYPDMVSDTARASAWAVESFARPVVLIGHSAGGYNVLQAVFAPEISAEAGLDVCASVAGVVGLAPPTGAYELTDEPYVTIFPDRFLGDSAPLFRAEQGRADVPPLLLAHGADDTTVGLKNSEELAALTGAELRIYQGRNHIDTVKLLSRFFDDDETLKSDILTWMAALDTTGPFCGR